MEPTSQNIRWSLNEFFNSLNDPKIQKTLDTTLIKAKEFALKYKNKVVKLTAIELANALKEKEDLLSPCYKLRQYISLLHSIDTNDEKTKKLLEKVDETESYIANEMLFFKLELAKIKSKDLNLLTKTSNLKNYQYYLQQNKNLAKYNLSEKEEKIVNLKNLTGSLAAKKLYQIFTSDFEFEFTLDNKKQKLNGSQLRNLRHHEDPCVRRSAMKLFFKKYKDNELIITHLYNTILKDYQIECNLRGYKEPMSVMNTYNDLPDNAVNLLQNVTAKSYPLVGRYYKIKQKILKLDQMTLADIYAPLPKSSTKFTWEEAKEIVLEGLSKFDQDFYLKGKLMFDENRIDAPVEPKKRGGAFCSSSIPSLNPFVMLNFLGKERDISTMAHELGHAIHSQFSAKQNLFNFHARLPLAETASVFSEMLITDLILKKETDKATKISLLTSKLEDIFATSHRQNMFFSFEKKSHDLASKTKASSEELCSLYKKELKSMFAGAVKLTPEYDWEWASIPHIFEVPFYVYAYNFGNLLVLAMYEKYLEEGKSFIPKYKEFLA
ncbi:MAG: M3 family oligoendopeptidase, partial [Candidatus Margulisiibacteriota bacterium]